VLLAELAGRSAAARDRLAASGLGPGNLGWVPVRPGGLAPGLHASVRVPDGRVSGPSVARLARWVAVAEMCYEPGAPGPAPDCTLRAWGAFTALHGRLANSGSVRRVPAEPGPGELLGALGGELARVGRVPGFAGLFLDRMRAAPAHTMVLVGVYPAGERLGHVFWAYAAPLRGGGVTVRWVDTQMPGQFERAARPGDLWATLLACPDTTILWLDPAGYPADAGIGSGARVRPSPAWQAPASRTSPKPGRELRGAAAVTHARLQAQEGFRARDNARPQPREPARDAADNAAVDAAARPAVTAAASASGRHTTAGRAGPASVMAPEAARAAADTMGGAWRVQDAGDALAGARPLAGGLSYLAAGSGRKLAGREVPAAAAGPGVAGFPQAAGDGGAGGGAPAPRPSGREGTAAAAPGMPPGGRAGRRAGAAGNGEAAVSAALVSAMAQVAAARPWDGRTPDCAWRVGEVIRRLSEPLAAVDDFSGLGEAAGVARRLGGWFVPGELGWLGQLRPGGVTVARVDRPGLRAHLVVVERLADGRLVMAETQATPGQARFTPFGPRAAAGPEALPEVLPEVLRGPVRLVESASGGLAQLEPAGHAEGTGQRPYRVARGITGLPPAADAGGRTVAALVDPHAGAPGMKFSLPWRRRPSGGQAPGPADAALRDAAALRRDVATVFVRGGFAGLDLRPVDELIARGAAEVVRIVPAGGVILGARDRARLGRRFAGTGATVFVPGPGSRVEARQLDLVALEPGGGRGLWVPLTGTMPDRGYLTTRTGRLARDMTRLDIEPGEGELVSWAGEMSALEVSLAAQPGDSARTFGLELEFDLGSGITETERARRMARIVAELSRFGLTTQDQIIDYHATRDAGYTYDPDGWRLEEEPTVPGGGEVVSPILRLRSPAGQRATWASVALVIAIVRRHGGTGSYLVGGHIHVGVGDFHRDIAWLARLLGLWQGHQDALFRLSQLGERYHRGIQDMRPLPEPAGGYEAQAQAQLDEDDPSYAVALDAVGRRQRSGQAPEGDHVEFRLWGGHLDLGAIQARVRLSLALTDAATRHDQPLPARQPLGEHYHSQDADADDAALRGLLSLLPPSGGLARAQVTRLWQLNTWQPPLAEGIVGWRHLLWANQHLTDEDIESRPVWEGYSQAAAGYPAPVIMLVPPGTGTELAEPLRRMTLMFDPSGAQVTWQQRETLRSQLEDLGPRDGARPVIIALRPAETGQFARQGAWLVRPVRDGGRFRIILDQGPPHQAGWRSEHGWELISPDGARRVLPSTLLDRAAVQEALGIVRGTAGNTPRRIAGIALPR
jgi:hypothetical protein